MFTPRPLLDGGDVEPPPFLPLPSFWSDQGELWLQSYGAPGLADERAIAEGDAGQLAKGLLVTYHRSGRLVGGVAAVGHSPATCAATSSGAR